MRWCQLGFGRTSKTGAEQETPRNLMGFKDGTSNILNDDQKDLDKFVWSGDDGPEWMRGGSYMVTRRIRMMIEVWDSTRSPTRKTIGRLQGKAAPRSAAARRRPGRPPRQARQKPLIPADAHIRVRPRPQTQARGSSGAATPSPTASDRPGPARRRASSSSAFLRDPRPQFVPIQIRLGSNDRSTNTSSTPAAHFLRFPPGSGTGRLHRRTPLSLLTQKSDPNPSVFVRVPRVALTYADFAFLSAFVRIKAKSAKTGADA